MPRMAQAASSTYESKPALSTLVRQIVEICYTVAALRPNLTMPQSPDSEVVDGDWPKADVVVGATVIASSDVPFLVEQVDAGFRPDCLCR